MWNFGEGDCLVLISQFSQPDFIFLREGQIQPKGCFIQSDVLFWLVIRRWFGALSALVTVLLTAFWSQWQRSLELLFLLLHILQLWH